MFSVSNFSSSDIRILQNSFIFCTRHHHRSEDFPTIINVFLRFYAEIFFHCINFPQTSVIFDRILSNWEVFENGPVTFHNNQQKCKDTIFGRHRHPPFLSPENYHFYPILHSLRTSFYTFCKLVYGYKV